LLLDNADEQDFGMMTSGFPVVGLRVRIWWTSFESPFDATVKRWSKRHQQWVLKYDLWEDTVLEDVPVVKWEFIP